MHERDGGDGAWRTFCAPTTVAVALAYARGQEGREVSLVPQLAEPAVQLRHRRPEEPSGAQVRRVPSSPSRSWWAESLVVRSLEPSDERDVVLGQEVWNAHDSGQRGHGAAAQSS